MHQLGSYFIAPWRAATRSALTAALALGTIAASGCVDASISLLPELADQGDDDSRPCTSESDCGEHTPICDPARKVCVECVSDADCSGDGPDKCLRSEGECVQCLGDLDCESDEPFCDLDGHRCEECLLDQHCPTGEICDADEERCVDPPQ